MCGIYCIYVLKGYTVLCIANTFDCYLWQWQDKSLLQIQLYFFDCNEGLLSLLLLLSLAATFAFYFWPCVFQSVDAHRETFVCNSDTFKYMQISSSNKNNNSNNNSNNNYVRRCQVVKIKLSSSSPKKERDVAVVAVVVVACHVARGRIQKLFAIVVVAAVAAILRQMQTVNNVAVAWAECQHLDNFWAKLKGKTATATLKWQLRGGCCCCHCHQQPTQNKK